jgi:hypothetical protein
MSREILVEPTPEINTEWLRVPAAIRARLALENIRSPADWRALSRAKRRRLFGITPSMVAVIDAVAREGS